MAARPVHERKGKAAWTHYRVKNVSAALPFLISKFYPAVPIKFVPISMASAIRRGDPLYLCKQPDRRLFPPRILLQSVKLSFEDPTTHEQKTYSIEPDAAFDVVLTQLTLTILFSFVFL